jgi:hypothetical protein
MLAQLNIYMPMSVFGIGILWGEVGEFKMHAALETKRYWV